jgi:hypothetical protein
MLEISKDKEDFYKAPFIHPNAKRTEIPPIDGEQVFTKPSQDFQKYRLGNPWPTP